MLVIDCRELTVDEKMALASFISDELSGAALALINGEDIVLDEIAHSPVATGRVEGIVRRFVLRRRDTQNYSVEREGARMVVHSAHPIVARHDRKHNELPPNLIKCPFCPFLTPYEEMYTIHVRAHGGRHWLRAVPELISPVVGSG